MFRVISQILWYIVVLTYKTIPPNHGMLEKKLYENLPSHMCSAYIRLCNWRWFLCARFRQTEGGIRCGWNLTYVYTLYIGRIIIHLLVKLWAMLGKYHNKKKSLFFTLIGVCLPSINITVSDFKGMVFELLFLRAFLFLIIAFHSIHIFSMSRLVLCLKIFLN